MIIKQKEAPLVLSGWRNLGTVLRIVLAVNLGMLLIVLGSADSWRSFLSRFINPVVFVEPYLFLELSVLWLVGPRLARLTRKQQFLALTAITIACGAIVAELSESTDPAPFAWVLFWGLTAQTLLLYYFYMRDKMLSPAITEARLQALQARIRPHFLFNSINAVMSIVRYDPVRAEGALQDMADMFRTLMRDNSNLAPLSAEIELCRQYLAIEKLRLGDRLSVEWTMPEMPEEALVPPLILQPLLENAVHHGIESSPKGGVISINLYTAHGTLHAVLRNPYHTKKNEHHQGNRIALDNVRQRLALHYDAEASLEHRVIDHAIYEVHIRIPYHSKDTRSGMITSAEEEKHE